MGTDATPINERRITLQQWENMLASYRELSPPVQGAITAAAQAAQVNRRTATRAWEKGFGYLGKVPIQEVLLEEKFAARATAMDVTLAAAREQTQAQADRAYQEAERARADAVKSRRQEGDMVRAQRGNLMALIGVSGSVLRGALKQAREIEKIVETGVDPANNQKLTLGQKVDTLWKLSRIVAQTATSSAEVIRMERLLLGEPTEIIGTLELGDLSEDQAIAEIREAQEAAQRILERRSKLRVVGGGA